MRSATRDRLGALIAIAACVGCSSSGSSRDSNPPTDADDASARMLGHIRALASDDFEGRAPGTRGEERTVAYLQGELKELGLEPGNPDGTWVQSVPLVGFTTRATATFDVGGKRFEPRGSQDMMLVSRRQAPEASVVDSNVVFCGYGVVAPEYGWDDFAGLDVRGKTLIVLVNDPPVADPADPSRLDASQFGGTAMTYYGRWTYKYEITAEKGAAAVLIVHEEGPAGYPWEVVSGSWGRENFDIVARDANAARPAIEGWITRAKAEELLSDCGQDFDALKARAAQRGFRPVELDARASFTARNDLRRVDSRNVIARLPGTDPARAGEHVLYMAHWDHLGVDPTREGDGIFNGAVDNASGCAGILEIARELVHGPRPPRSFLFLFVTAEEKGLLGSRWYAEHPLWPLADTLCAINMDSLNSWGPTADIVSVGQGSSTLDELLVEVCRPLGRTVRGDESPEKGYFYRSDHFELMKRGVPALYADGGVELIGREEGEGLRRAREYTQHDYHKPSDEPKSDWDLSGAVLDMQLLAEVGRRVATDAARPEWRPTSEFRAAGDALRKQ
jgi:Zn-dependent M28 family amino/carboxypeptidase